MDRNEDERTTFKSEGDVLFANMKRMMEEFLQESLETTRHCRTHFDELITHAREHNNQVNNIALQALQNAVETANLVGKGAAEKSDLNGKLAINKCWNVEAEEAAGISTILSSTDVVALKAIAAYIVEAMQKADSTEED